MNEHPNLAKLLVLSSKHLDPSNHSDWFILNNHDRRLIYQPCTLQSTLYGHGFQRARILACELGATYIYFDDLEPPLKSLPVYDS
jgi:hypothetical protein